MEYSRVLGATLFSGDVRVDAEHPLTAPDQQTAELVLTPASPLRDRTLAQANFDWHYQLIPLAVQAGVDCSWADEAMPVTRSSISATLPTMPRSTSPV